MNITSNFTIEGRIDAVMHNVSDLQAAADDYDSLSDTEKMELARSVDPEHKETVYNVTTERLHQYFVDNLDRNQTSTEDDLFASWFSVGTDGGGGTAITDTDLNTRIFEKEITDVSDNGTDLLCSTFLSSTEANDPNDLDELGLWTGDPANSANAEVFLMNHATFSSVTKDNSKTLTFDVTLTFADQ